MKSFKHKDFLAELSRATSYHPSASRALRNNLKPRASAQAAVTSLDSRIV